MASQKFREYVDGLTEDTNPDIDADLVHTNDASASAPKKVKIRNLTKNRVFDTTTIANNTAVGDKISGQVSHQALAQWDAVGLTSGGKWNLASNEDGVTIPAQGLAVAATAGADEAVTVLVYGIVRNDSWTWTVGGAIYLGVDGALTQTTPSSSGEIVQKVGYAISADIAFFDFNSTVIEIA